MPRQLRIQCPGAMYHVMSRGNRRAEIFLDDVDRHDFLKTPVEACQKTRWQVHACCLMANHYHLVLGPLSRALRRITFSGRAAGRPHQGGRRCAG